uniref:Deoxyhypusine hydroxylase n=1 Tax=Lygus hesperus TaxID=30085 RepID=A0A0A9XN02_LYGHE
MFRLKESFLKTVPGVLLLLEAIDTTDSVLLQHEMAYNVGQSGCEEAVPRLAAIVRNRDKYNLVTRHEAAESLGALGFASAIPVLTEFASSKHEPEVAVRETCELALTRVQMSLAAGVDALAPPIGCPFVSIDPSPAFSSHLL